METTSEEYQFTTSTSKLNKSSFFNILAQINMFMPTSKLKSPFKNIPDFRM